MDGLVDTPCSMVDATETGGGTHVAQRELTYGEKAVGFTFNPSNNPMVHIMKSQYASIINILNDMRNKTESQEMKRHLSIAITEAETAQMRAVKALTWKD